MSGQESASTLIFDNLDIDLIYKVSSHTLFSPFFTFFVPLIYKGLRAPWTAPTVYISTGWFLFVTGIWLFQTLSNRWRNSGIRGRLDWGEQIVLVTGGSSGVGALLANTLAVRHVTVVVLDLKPIETDNHNITYYKCDVSNAEEVNAVAKQIREEIGEPTIIVNNAGVIQGKSILELKNEDVLQTVGVNLVAHFNILRTFLPAIVEEKQGHIITVSSVMGLVSAAKAADYCATKAAVISLHETLRYELDSIYNAPLVRTTLVTPGHIITPMMAGLKPLSQGSPLPKALHNFLMPPLQPHTVVKAIIAAMDDQESRDIALPLYTQTGWFARSFPYFIRDTIQKLAGADYAMNGFRKTTGLRSEEIVKS